MSRCCPFPPPNYANKGEALVQLIKLQRQKEAKAQRKLKKQLRKQCKDKEKKSVTDEKVKRVKDDESCQLRKSKVYSNAAYPSKKIDEESEKSDLTEEHELPTCPGSISYLSDSGQSSNKRKRQDSSLSGKNNQGLVLRIRLLPLRKHIDSDASLGKQDKNCLAKGSKTRSQERTQPNAELSCHANAETNVEFEKQEKAEATGALETRSHVNGIQSSESLYTTLIENWVPPGHQLEQTDFDDDQEWLFGSKQQNRQDSKRHKASTKVPCSRSSTLWPRANYLPEFDLYALPYTVPL